MYFKKENYKTFKKEIEDTQKRKIFYVCGLK